MQVLGEGCLLWGPSRVGERGGGYEEANALLPFPNLACVDTRTYPQAEYVIFCDVVTSR
jgi:hypothetical protein